jgi:hypothetical protein
LYIEKKLTKLASLRWKLICVSDERRFSADMKTIQEEELSFQFNFPLAAPLNANKSYKEALHCSAHKSGVQFRRANRFTFNLLRNIAVTFLSKQTCVSIVAKFVNGAQNLRY